MWRRPCNVSFAETALVALCTRDLAGAISEGDTEMQRLIDSQVESHKIGSAIAEEVLRRSSTDFSPELPTELLQDAVFNQQVHYIGV